jgi:hypothetical protein
MELAENVSRVCKMGKQNLPIYGIFIAATHEQFFTE